MMKNKALQFYRQGYNCSQCILKAAECKFNIPVSKQSLNCCAAINNGFGIGGMCSVLIAGVMVFGMLFDEQTAKRLRLRLLDDFHSKFKGINCGHITKGRDEIDSCEDIIGEIADMIEKYVTEERG